MENKKNILKRTYLLYFLMLVLALGVFVRIIHVQFIEGNKWRKQAEERTIEFRTIQAVRGNIYDAEGGLLATSLPIFEIRWDPNAEAITDEVFNDNVDSLARSLSGVFPYKSPFQWKRKLVDAREDGERYTLIARKVSYRDFKKIREFPIFRKGRWRGGFLYKQRNKRQKPFRRLAARTIGYEREGITSVGLEGAYGNQLSGVSGQRLERKIMNGVWMPISDGNELEPEDGYDLYTSIDVNIQDVAENALLKQLTRHDAAHGCVVLMEVETGEVRAIANLSRGEDGGYYESYNYAVGASTEPGSTFKLASYMAALEDGFIDLNHKIETGNGRYKFTDTWMEDSKVGGFGTISVKDAFALSSNIAIGKIIQKHYRSNPQSFIDRLRSMRLDQPLGIEIAGEGQPYIKSANDESWSGISLPWISHGYEVQLTPLQILTFYNAVANGGTMVKPMFVRSLRKGNDVIQDFEPVVLKEQIASAETIKKVKQMLEEVVKSGTGANLANANYSIAGKTGTAQIANSKYGYRSSVGISHQASFCGYFPAEKPKYSCIVVVNAPSKNVYYGNLVAGPIFKEIADKVYSTRVEMHEELKPLQPDALTKIPVAKNSFLHDLETIYGDIGVKYSLTAQQKDWVVPETLADSVKLHPKDLVRNQVPNVKGMNSQDAIYLLENMGLSVEIRGRGAVENQSINPGRRIEKGEKIILQLA